MRPIDEGGILKTGNWRNDEIAEEEEEVVVGGALTRMEIVQGAITRKGRGC